MKRASLYIHIPYCVSKCIYCDFFSGGASHADWSLLVDSLINELKARKGELSITPDTLYIGGGTPSLIPESEFSRLISSINDIYENSAKWREFTIEVNPDDVTEEKCKVWRDAGVSRLSMGIQSLNDGELKAIRRRHTAEEAISAFRLLRKYFDNVSVDLMFGIPGQTLESWSQSVDRVIDMRPEHLSAYSLMLEEGTALTTLYTQGRVALPDDEECDAMWRMLSEKLAYAGYEQYEISNYSLSGFRSVHNSRYWYGNPYLGLGPSAHSYDGKNIRRCNLSDIKGYLSHFGNTENASMSEDWKDNFYMEETLTQEELFEERILTGIRVKEGIDLKMFGADFGESQLQRLLKNASPLVASGDIKIENDSLALTSKGIMLSNRVILALSM